MNNLFPILGGKFKFSAQDSDLEYSSWQRKNPPGSSDLKPPLTSSYFALIESDDRPVNRECPICTHSIHYMSIGMRILVALIKTISCTIFEVSTCPALKKSIRYISECTANDF